MTVAAPPDLDNWLALHLVPGLGPRLTTALLEHFGEVGRIRRATATQLRQVPRIGSKLADDFAQALARVDVAAERERMARHGVEAILKGSPEYPALLATIPDPPYVLYRRGCPLLANQPAIAIVGSRRCTPYGRRITQRLAGDLVNAGYVVVSGLALGIDGEAHRGALRAKGRTLAVLAGGLSRIYPPPHTQLAAEVASSGALLSETPMAMAPQAGMFHARNRLISGLARAVVVVEASQRSGALITVHHAAEQGREVFVFPGNVDSSASAGTLQLMRDGAPMIRDAADLLEDLDGIAPLLPATFEHAGRASPTAVPRPTGSDAALPQGMDPLQRRIWDALEEPRFADELVERLEISVTTLSRVLVQMEMQKWVSRRPGNQYIRSASSSGYTGFFSADPP